MKPELQGRIKFGVWGLVCGAIVAIIIGFSWGGWSTASATKAVADEAVLASQAAICVAQFVADPNYQEKLKEIEALDSWKRAEFIKKGGWDKMPGQEKAGYDVSGSCADGIALLIKK